MYELPERAWKCSLNVHFHVGSLLFLALFGSLRASLALFSLSLYREREKSTEQRAIKRKGLFFADRFLGGVVLWCFNERVIFCT